MANALYPKYKVSLLTGASNRSLNQNTTTDGVYVAIIDTGSYTYNTAHEFYSDLTGVIAETRLLNPSISSGHVLDSDDPLFASVTGTTGEALVIFRKNSGANTTWALVAYLDTSVTGLPVTPDGGDIQIIWNTSGIFKL